VVIASDGSRYRQAIEFAVLVSGAGSNLQALIDSGLPGLGLVISDVAEAAALTRAEKAGIPTQVVPYQGDRTSFTTAICDAASGGGAEALVLAGFMRILGTEAVERFRWRILNIHPSLLPAFPGVDAVGQALAYGVKVTGVTVHFVTEEVDGGPIIFQRAVPVLPGDDEASLHARIQQVEHEIYPRVVDAFLRGEIRVEQRRAVWW
jgi:phosphoribosylglycinamide formyltransferase-1